MATPANHQDYPAHNTRSHSSLSSSSSSSSDSDSSDDTVVSTAKMAETIIKPKLFKGSVLEDPQHWLYLYEQFITVTKYDDDQAAACFGHFMENTAEILYKGLSNTIKDDFNLLKDNFKDTFINDLDKGQREREFFSVSQGHEESARDYVMKAKQQSVTLLTIPRNKGVTFLG